jgi:NADP-dependent 3-hydroxy acid dehydrogenase YdfG
MDTLQDKVAVVTGAGSGIGHAIANSLAARGAHIVAVDIDADRLATAAEELASLDVGVQ